ncbi:MAG: CPBP family intramembrane metalloprotease, partial [Acidobacteriota bacterium]
MSTDDGPNRSGSTSGRPGRFSGRAISRPLLILAVFWIASRMQEVAVRVPGYAELYERHPFWVPEGLRSLAEIALVVIAVAALHRIGVPGALRELGFRRRPWPGLVFGMVAALPMWAVFSLTMPVAGEVDPWAVVYLAGLSPLAEESVFRAFAFGQLRRQGWGFWWAVLVPAAVFG